MRTLNDFLSIPIVRSFDVPCVNGPYVFPVPKNFPDLVRRLDSSKTWRDLRQAVAGIARKSLSRRYASIFADQACLRISYWKL